MNRTYRCWLHFRCIVVKAAKGRDWQWHWMHIQREFRQGDII